MKLKSNEISLKRFLAAVHEQERLEVIDDPHFGMLRVAGAVTYTSLANPFANLERHLMMVQKAKKLEVDVLQFGELSLTGYSCGRYFQQDKLLRDAERALLAFVQGVKKIGYDGFVVVGVPLVIGHGLYNCAVAICGGKILGVTVKRHPPNYEEFLELKVFAYADTLTQDWVRIGGKKVPVGIFMVYDCENIKDARIGVGICEDNWTLNASANILAANGATVLLDLSGSDELIGKEDFRFDQQVTGLSSRNIAICLYVSQGPGESSSHVVFSGACGIAENGTMLAKTKPLDWVDTVADPEKRGESMICADVDLDHIRYDRKRTNSHIVASRELAAKFPARFIAFTMKRSKQPRILLRKIDARPYVPSSPAAFDAVCRKLTKIQLAANITRIMQTGSKALWLALSGGSDSMNQLTQLVAVSDALGFARTAVNIVTMPGFGTTKETYNIAVETAQAFGCTLHINDIKPITFAFLKAIGHKPFGIADREDGPRDVHREAERASRAGDQEGRSDLRERAGPYPHCGSDQTWLHAGHRRYVGVNDRLVHLSGRPGRWSLQLSGFRAQDAREAAAVVGRSERQGREGSRPLPAHLRLDCFARAVAHRSKW